MDIGEFLGDLIKSLLLWFDGFIYTLSSSCYRIFFVLATANFFDTTTYGFLIYRIEAILGTVMLFYSAYFILTNMANPQKAFGGDAQKQLINYITTVLLLIFMPVIFNFVDSVHTTILNSGVIPKFLFGTGSNIADKINGKDNPNIKGNFITEILFECFLHPQDSSNDGSDIMANEAFTIKAPVGSNSNGYATGEEITIQSYKSTKGYSGDSGDYYKFTHFTKKISLTDPDQGELSYRPIISTLAGIGLIYMLLTYCIDLASRVFKLAVLQIISPIPVFARILPSKKGLFDKWVKEVVKVYTEVIIRVFTLYIMVLMIALLFADQGSGQSIFDSIFTSLGAYDDVRAFVIAFLILGFLLFASQFPKFITDMLGVSTGGLGLKKWGEFLKPAAAGAGLAVGAAGAGLISAGSNIRANWKQNAGIWKNGELENKNFKEKAGIISKRIGSTVGATFKGAGSAIAGAASGATRGAINGAKSKNPKDIWKNASKSYNQAVDAREDRDTRHARYRAEGHTGSFGTGIIAGHVSDIAANFSGRKMAGYQKDMDLYDKMKKSDDIIKSLAEKRFEEGKYDSGMFAGFDFEHGFDKSSNTKALMKLSQGFGGMSPEEILQEIELWKKTGMDSSGFAHSAGEIALANEMYDIMKKSAVEKITRISGGEEVVDDATTKAIREAAKLDTKGAELQSAVKDFQQQLRSVASVSQKDENGNITVHNYTDGSYDNRKEMVDALQANRNLAAANASKLQQRKDAIAAEKKGGK